ncbi:interferon lambda-3-like [Discoglossus pictus]
MGTVIRLAAMTVLLGIVTAHPLRRHCPMSRYRLVSETDMKTLRHLQERYEDVVVKDGMKCYQRMLRHKPSACKLEASDRLTLTLERVSLAVDVLTNMTDSPLSDLVSQPLEIFSVLEQDLTLCRRSLLFSDPPTQHVKPWLQHLRRYKKMVSSECLQETVILSLIQLLVEDVKCWASSEQISSPSENPHRPRRV